MGDPRNDADLGEHDAVVNAKGVQKAGEAQSDFDREIRQLFDKHILPRVLTIVGLSGGIAGALGRLLRECLDVSKALLVTMLLPAVLILIVAGWVAYRVGFLRLSIALNKRTAEQRQPPIGRERTLIGVALGVAAILSASAGYHYLSDLVEVRRVVVDSNLLRSGSCIRPVSTGQSDSIDLNALAIRLHMCDSSLALLARQPDSVATGFAPSDALWMLVEPATMARFDHDEIAGNVTYAQCVALTENGPMEEDLLQRRRTLAARRMEATRSEQQLDTLRVRQAWCQHLAGLLQGRYARAHTALRQEIRTLADALQTGIARRMGLHRWFVLGGFLFLFIAVLSLPVSVIERNDPMPLRVRAFRSYLIGVLATPVATAVLVAMPWLGQLAPEQVPLRSASELLALSSWEGIRVNSPIPLADSSWKATARRIELLILCGAPTDTAGDPVALCRQERGDASSEQAKANALTSKLVDLLQGIKDVDEKRTDELKRISERLP